ncbi:MAG: amidohydrolase family protein [Acidimicrobiia bacterium]
MTERATRAVLRGAQVIDGTGAPAVRADVAIADGRIEAVGPDLESDAAEVDLAGLVLAPGFIDPHTHYDAQLFWDPDLTPSSWHGVTTVVTGNCGFTVAPTRPAHRDVIIRTLENVEGMTVETLVAGMPWTFETFPEYLGAVAALPKRLNVACMIGHTTLRWYVLGDEAADREATEVEVDRMCELVREAIEAGAVGFSTSRHDHVGAFGKPVPSRAASVDELTRIARTLGDADRGTIEVAIGPTFGIDAAVHLAEVSGHPVTWSSSALVPMAGEHGMDAAMAAVDAAAVPGVAAYPQFPVRPIVNLVTLRDPFPLRAASPGFIDALGAEPGDRYALYADHGWRDRTRATLTPLWKERLADAMVAETTRHMQVRNGPTLGELAAARGTTPFDVLVDLSLAEDLDTRFRMTMANNDAAVIEALLRDVRCLVGLSDAGAHVTQLCDANYATYLLGYWVRERGALPLELAVWRLTGQPAAVYGIRDRGRIEAGAAADLVAFDASTVGSGEAERVWDFPGGTDRLVAASTGVEFVWVNGTATRSDGTDVPGVSTGRLLGR